MIHPELIGRHFNGKQHTLKKLTAVLQSDEADTWYKGLRSWKNIGSTPRERRIRDNINSIIKTFGFNKEYSDDIHLLAQWFINEYPQSIAEDRFDRGKARFYSLMKELKYVFFSSPLQNIRITIDYGEVAKPKRLVIGRSRGKTHPGDAFVLLSLKKLVDEQNFDSNKADIEVIPNRPPASSIKVRNSFIKSLDNLLSEMGALPKSNQPKKDRQNFIASFLTSLGLDTDEEVAKKAVQGK